MAARLALLLLVCAPGCCFGGVSRACQDACAAAERGDTAQLAVLAADPAVLTCGDAEGFGPIHHAASEGSVAAVTWLLDHGVPIEAQGGRERTALYEAAKFGHVDTVRLLLDRGADIETRGDTGHTPWLVAAERGHLAVLELLLERGADVSVITNQGLDSVFAHTANGPGTSAILAYLLAHGGSVDLHNGEGWTALHHAVYRNGAELTSLLLDAGANPNITTTGASTPLGIAESRGYAPIAAILIAHGARRASDATIDSPPPLTRSLTLPGVVVASGGARPPIVGTRCTVHVRPTEPSARFNCQMSVDCEGGAQLYGGSSSGLVYCEDRPEGLRAFDPWITPGDGDPAAELDVAAARFVVDDGLPGREGTRVRLVLDPLVTPPAAPSVETAP